MISDWSAGRSSRTPFFAGCDMSPGGTDGSRRGGKGKGSALPVGHTPSGGVRAGLRGAQAPGGTPPSFPTPSAVVRQETVAMESLKAEVETLRSRLMAQEASNKSLAAANDLLVADVTALRLADPVADPRLVAKSRRHTTSDGQGRRLGGGPSSSRSVPIGSVAHREHRARALKAELLQLKEESKLARALARVAESPTSSEDESGGTPNGAATSAEDDADGPAGPPSPPSSEDDALSSDTASEFHSWRARHGRRPRRRRGDLVEIADRRKVIRPANSRFKSLLDYRTYFLARRSTAYPPSLVEKAHKMNRRLDGAFQGQEPFTGSDPLGVFTFLTTFRRACDASGVTHGQALPLLAFRLAGPAKRAFSSALNRAGGGQHTVHTYGDAVNWLLAKYATHSVMATAYHAIITMRQEDQEAPTMFGLRVESHCDRLDGLFHVQDVKDVFINGLNEVIQAHVRVLDGQFPDRSMADTVAAAQMYWDGTNKLRQSLRTSRASPAKAVPLNVDNPRSMDRPHGAGPTPVAKTPPPSPSRGDICYNCNKPGHFAAQCTEPYHQRERRLAHTTRVATVVMDTDHDAVTEPANSKNE